MKVTIFMDLGSGGVADYAHAQATFLAAQGADVDMLCTPDFLASRDPGYKTSPILKDWRGPGGDKLSKARRALDLVGNFRMLADHVMHHSPDAVLTQFSEYLSPFWAPRLRRLRRGGTVFASVLHDPVRDYQVGPRWWHERSVRDAFSFLDVVFVHTLDPISVPGTAEVKWIPHGLFAFPDPTTPRDEVRRKLNVPDDATLALSYGYLRDNKNLDLGIEAVARSPGVHLLVAGRDQSTRNKPVEHYQQLAKSLGCADRVHWMNRFISEAETADLMTASDVLLLTYSRSFMSWSGVLSLAARYRLPAIVSAGTKTLGALVERFKTGVNVEPDSITAIQKGLVTWADLNAAPDWDGYQAEMSWARNAELVMENIAEQKGLR